MPTCNRAVSAIKRGYPYVVHGGRICVVEEDSKAKEGETSSNTVDLANFQALIAARGEPAIFFVVYYHGPVRTRTSTKMLQVLQGAVGGTIVYENAFVGRSAALNDAFQAHAGVVQLIAT